MTWTSSIASAQAYLHLNSDLVLHPDQVSGVFMSAADKINKSSEWNWPELSFTSPYQTRWTGVKAKGPFTLAVHTEQLNAQEVSFELYWPNPTITAENFNVHDTVIRDIGGVQVIINIDGACQQLTWQAPGANWKVRGKLSWYLVGNEVQAQWREFVFQPTNASTPTTQIGPCQGPEMVSTALRDNVAALTSDNGKLSELIQKGILLWLNSSLQPFNAELMKAQQAPVKDGLTLLWQPQTVMNLPGGMLRVPGVLSLRRDGMNNIPMSINRTQSDEVLATARESGFVLPKTALDEVTRFIFATGDLKRRYLSTEVKSFQDLMNNSFNRNYVWPDLSNFSTRTLFYFDLSTEAPPYLTNLRANSSSGGVAYDVRVPVLLNDWAPYGGTYYPYVDFRSTAKGIARLTVESGKLNLRLPTSSLPLSGAFRSEFKRKRTVDEYLDTGRLSTAVKDMLNQKVILLDLPTWQIRQGQNINITNVKVWGESVFLPLVLK